MTRPRAHHHRRTVCAACDSVLQECGCESRKIPTYVMCAPCRTEYGRPCPKCGWSSGEVTDAGILLISRLGANGIACPKCGTEIWRKKT